MTSTTTTSAVPAPDAVLAVGDPGDDTAYRFVYQWTYAAIICCMLLDDLEDVAEVFCEHHEDILLKHSDGLFSGLQVKTKEAGQPVWKTSDEAVISACARFAKLEATFPGHFRTFRFLTNHPLYAAGNGMDLRHVLESLRTCADAASAPSTATAFLKKVAKQGGCVIAAALAALKKTEASDALPKLQDVLTRLVMALTSVWKVAENCTAPVLLRAANHLANECGKASSLAHANLLPAYLPASANPIAAELAARLVAKRIDKQKLLGLLDGGLNQTALLHGAGESMGMLAPAQQDLLLQKLDAGGFSAVSRNSAVDLRDKAEYLGVMWVQKHGKEAGLKRYGHVRSLVLADAAKSFEAKKNTDPFGVTMLADLRDRLLQRQKAGAQLYDASNEHLEGVAYSLTAECKVQWSQAEPWKRT